MDRCYRIAIKREGVTFVYGGWRKAIRDLKSKDSPCVTSCLHKCKPDGKAFDRCTQMVLEPIGETIEGSDPYFRFANKEIALAHLVQLRTFWHLTFADAFIVEDDGAPGEFWVPFKTNLLVFGYAGDN